jgi:hypothetical protein
MQIHYILNRFRFQEAIFSHKCIAPSSVRCTCCSDRVPHHSRRVLLIAEHYPGKARILVVFQERAHHLLLKDPLVPHPTPVGCCSRAHHLLLKDPLVTHPTPVGCCSRAHRQQRTRIRHWHTGLDKVSSVPIED